MRVQIALLTLTLAACAGAGADAARVMVPGQPQSLAPGEQAALPSGGRLRFVEVRDDSRCPPGVQCVHAGEATVVFELHAPPAAPARLTLSTARLPAAADAGAWRLTLLDLGSGSAPLAQVAVEPSR